MEQNMNKTGSGAAVGVQRVVRHTNQELETAGWVKQMNSKWRHDGYGVAHLCKDQAGAYQWLKTSMPNS